MRLGTDASSGWTLTSRAARAYEQHVVPRLHEPWARELVALAALEKGDRVLDVACGTGIVARVVAEILGPHAVVGVDANPRMLSIARTIDSTIVWREADAARLPVEDGAFDIVFCQHGVQFFSHRFEGLKEMRRALVPGGRLFLTVCASLDRNPYLLALAEALTAHVGSDAAGVVSGICGLGERDELETLLEQSGFVDVNIDRERKPAHFPPTQEFVFQHLAGLPVAEVVDGLAPKARTALVADMATRLGAYAGSAGLSVPFEIHCARARKAC